QAAARAALERMISERPEDGNAMLALARLCDREQLWPRAIELRKRAAQLAATPVKRAEIWLEIARNEESRGDADAALAALGQAEGAPRDEVMREQLRLHKSAGRADKAL